MKYAPPAFSWGHEGVVISVAVVWGDDIGDHEVVGNGGVYDI